MVEKTNWLPLESNPEIINKYVTGLGLDVTKFNFQELFSCDDWAQEMICRPCTALLLLYPMNNCVLEYEKKEKEEIKTNGQILSKKVSQTFFVYHLKKTYFMNTIGVIHAIMNMMDGNSDIVQKDSFFERFFEETKEQTAEERGKSFEKNSELKGAHKMAVEEGKSKIEDNVITHFICFVETEGHIYELDGRKDFPINHGKTEKGRLLENSCRIIKEVFMNRDPEELRFTLMALAKVN